MAQTKKPDGRREKDDALRWFVRLNSGDATSTDRAEHARWMSADPAHLQEYMKLATIWSDIDQLGDPRQRAPQRLAAAGFSRRRLLAGAAAVTAVAVGGFNLPLDRWLSDYSTGTGEQRTVVFPDGTTASLDAETAISLDFTDRARSLTLLQGRAFFDVAGDKVRPFVVQAGPGSTTALGTRFTVHEWADTVTVSVEESAVSVAMPDSSKAVIGVGQTVSYTRQGGLGAIEATDMEADGAWRRGKLIFEDRPLGQVISDVNRYRHGTIRIIDGRLQNLRVSGIFDVNNPDGVLDAITSALPVQAIRLTPYVVLLRAA